ncbi:hypothetical protein [Lichenicoccus sp.]|uniref:hypothetical protein n=1 Tax=Lichenicoccus sp. TaxID=2781899 RepID=UPI003D0D4754
MTESHRAAVGEAGLAETRVFTTLGDAANVASRIERLCRNYSCEAVSSDAVRRESGSGPDLLPRHEVVVRGRDAANRLSAHHWVGSPVASRR